MEIAQGDLSRRGEVTPDVLGSVIDSINVMVEEISVLLGDVRHAAFRVSGSAGEMISATDQMASGARPRPGEHQREPGGRDGESGRTRRGGQGAVRGRRRPTLEAARKAIRPCTTAGRYAADSRRVQIIAKKIKGSAIARWKSPRS